MKLKVAFLCAALAASGAAGCKKRGGGGGGGGWLVGSEGMMANINLSGSLGEGYDLGASESLYGIACRFHSEAWVVGAGGTLLFSPDGGSSWEAQNLGTQADLRALATQDSGAVFVAGAGVFMTAVPDRDGRATWTQLGDGVTSFRSLSAAQRGTTVLAVSDDGGIWAVANNQLVRRTTIPGVRSIDVSIDGRVAIAAGDGLFRSTDAGVTWTRLLTDAGLSYDAVSIDENNEAVAVGAAGVVSRIADDQVLTQRLGNAHLRAVHITPSSDYSGKGYAAGEGGQVWVTEDSGWSWTQGPIVAGTVFAVDEIGFGHN
jgi:photosystem II stability/assembly factor-like uncharacterized protein